MKEIVAQAEEEMWREYDEEFEEEQEREFEESAGKGKRW